MQTNDDTLWTTRMANMFWRMWCVSPLTHWGRVRHICVGNLTFIGSDNGLSPDRCQAIIWTNVGILLIGPQGTNFSEVLIEIHTFSIKKKRLKVSSEKWRPFCLGLNVLKMQSSPNSLMTRWFQGSSYLLYKTSTFFIALSKLLDMNFVAWHHCLPYKSQKA